MCENIDETQKRQPAHGFPKGWTVYFDRLDRNTGSRVREDLLGFRLVSPSGMRYRTSDLAIEHCKLGKADARKRLFYKQLGTSPKELILSHPLMNQKYCREWINVKGEKLIVYGRITEAFNGFLEDGTEFIVTYLKASSEFLNTHFSGSDGLFVPTKEKMCESQAWGGCLLYQSKQKNSQNLLPPRCNIRTRKWLIPDLYQSIIDPAFSLPHVLIHYGGFELKFVVKTSSIPNAGNGVFLSCSPLEEGESSRYFELDPGELLDFGVYAPYRDEDRKMEHEFLMKSFVHSFKCESYSFDTKDINHAYDITDDITGDLHKDARIHVPPYVNEASNWQVHIPEVHGMYDPQGALHYLLGYTEEVQVPFKVKADGTEREIFIDYGERYELVRLREGFPRVYYEQSIWKAKLEKDEEEYLDEIETYTAKEVKSAVKYFEEILTTALTTVEELESRVVERSLLVAILLRKRANKIKDDFTRPLEEDEAFCDNGATEIDLEQLVLSCSRLASKLCTMLGGDDDVQRKVLANQCVSNALDRTFPKPIVTHSLMSGGENYFSKLSPVEFRELLCTSVDFDKLWSQETINVAKDFFVGVEGRDSQNKLSETDQLGRVELDTAIQESVANKLEKENNQKMASQTDQLGDVKEPLDEIVGEGVIEAVTYSKANEDLALVSYDRDHNFSSNDEKKIDGNSDMVLGEPVKVGMADGQEARKESAEEAANNDAADPWVDDDATVTDDDFDRDYPWSPLADTC